LEEEMKTKNHISLARTTRSRLMGLAIILGTFGLWNLPVARAQEAAAETLAGAIVNLSADQASFVAADDAILHMTITNLTRYPIKMLKWLTPVDGVEGPLLTVTRDGEPVAYIGKLVKRAAPTEQDYILLAAGESLTWDVNLSTYYDLSTSGNYVVQYNVTSTDLYGGQSQNADPLTSNMLELSIEGRAKPVLQEVLPQAVSGTNSFIGCSASRQTDLISARNAASIYANEAVSYFSANMQGLRYITWFGVYNASRYSTVSSHFTAIRSAVDTAMPMTFDCSTCTEPNTYAYVFPNSPYKIYLCGAFWGAPMTGTDSKAGTLIHEISHFTVVADTNDYAYGQTAAKALAISNPANAIMNADSHEYFSENTPPIDEPDLTPPSVTSSVRVNPSPTNASSVNFTVTFSEAVTGVDIVTPFNDFALTTSPGISSASVTSVSGSGPTYSVTVNTGSGNGTIRLDVVDNDSIRDAANHPLGGVGAGNGNYTNGQVYTINKSSSADTTGVFRPSNGLLYLKNSNDTGFADVALNYGLPGDYPVVGDWDGNGTVTIGIYRNRTFYLRNENTLGFATIVFDFGQAGDQPIAGDWDGDGIDTIGIYRPSTGQFQLRDSNDAGPAEMSFFLGNVGDVGVAGDWNGDGFDTTGVFRPSNGVIFLKNTNDTGFADIALNYGLPGDMPVMGDWDNDGVDTIGIYRNGTFYLRNSNTNGFAEIVFSLGNPGDMPIAGNWDGSLP
jgi:peptidyl-Lys metalloendopeptidase